MVRLGRSVISQIFTGVFLTTVIFPGFLLAVPLAQSLKEDAGEKTSAADSSQKLVRNKRNISWYKQHSDFWNWYKYFTDNGNQEGVAELERVYLAYLQNKNRAEAKRSHKLYLQHLSDIYKSCSESDDPNCVASYTSRPKSKVEVPRLAPIKSCDPLRDPYCLYPLGYAHYPYQAPASVKTAAPAAVKTPAYIHSPVAKDPVSGYYYAPLAQSFLSAEQKAELLRICDPEDVECLQYHLRAAYGYRPAASYAHLSCDPKSDPHCIAQVVQKTPSGLYLRYPQCDPRDPYCAYHAAVMAAQQAEAPKAPVERPCNPLYDENCNPLKAVRFASLADSPDEHKDQPASVASSMRAPPSPQYDSMGMYQDAAATLRMRPPAPRQPPQHISPLTQEESRHPLGPPGKTKEGYDCFIGYDKDCYPVRAQTESRAVPSRQFPQPQEAYEPHLNNDGSRNGVIEPDPDCDPEYDRNCRLRRFEPESDDHMASGAQEQKPERLSAEELREESIRHEVPQRREDLYPKQQPENPSYDQQQYEQYMSGQEDPYATYGAQEQGPASFQDFLRGYGARYPGQNNHRGFAGDYKKK